jgi:Zn-dependent protease with chaperone function
VRLENQVLRVAVVLLPVVAAFRIGVEHLPTGVPSGPSIGAVVGPVGWTLIVLTVAAVSLGAWRIVVLVRAAAIERRILASRVPASSASAAWELTALAGRLGMPTPRLSEAPGIAAPVAIGRSEICLPRSVVPGLSPAELRAVLAHELSHLARRDSLWSAIAQVLARLVFLSPVRLWATRRVRETAEFLADELAVRETGGPEPLVGALTAFARAARPGLSVSGFAPGSLLLRRVARVLQGPAEGWPAGGPVSALLLAAVLALAWFGPTVAPACDCLLRTHP